MVMLERGAKIHTHLGWITHDAIIDQPFGSTVLTHLGQPYTLLPPSTIDIVMNVNRASQIVYPKEIAFILLKLNVIPGAHVVEAGTGSGALTIALARAVGPTGRVHTYEEREDMRENALKNFKRTGVDAIITSTARDIREGFDERDSDSLFLDVREPELYLPQAHAALVGGGFFGAIVPTTNQISEVLLGMDESGGWAEIEVVEILMRYYKPNADRLRPTDRMVAHTGFLIFARAVSRSQPIPQDTSKPLSDSAEQATC